MLGCNNRVRATHYNIKMTSSDDKVQERTETAVDDAESAITMILLAEAQARDEVARAEQEAAALVETARRQAGNILARASGRISRLHAVCAEQQHREMQRMLEEPGTGDESPPLPDAHQREILQAAVESLAAELTGDARQ